MKASTHRIPPAPGKITAVLMAVALATLSTACLAQPAASPQASGHPKGPFNLEMSQNGDRVKMTDANGVTHEFAFIPVCPDGQHLVWTGVGLACVN